MPLFVITYFRIQNGLIECFILFEEHAHPFINIKHPPILKYNKIGLFLATADCKLILQTILPSMLH